MFGSNESSLCFFETNLPETFENMHAEEAEAQRLAEECDFLVKELEKERTSNNDLQRQIITKRKRYDEMCAMMVLLRGYRELEANPTSSSPYTKAHPRRSLASLRSS